MRFTQTFPTAFLVACALVPRPAAAQVYDLIDLGEIGRASCRVRV